MASEPTITLRDVAIRLASVSSAKTKFADGKLLNLLKLGELTAGFDFPGRVLRWISIPPSYWATVGSDRFRSIRRSRADKKTIGAYKVMICEFQNEYLKIVMQECAAERSRLKDGSDTTIIEELKAAVVNARHQYEVVVTEQAWNAYLIGLQLEEPVREAKTKSGRHEKKGWRKVSVIIGAYIIKHYETTKEAIKIEEVSKKIHEIAREDGISDLPAAMTIKELLSEIRSRADTLSIN